MKLFRTFDFNGNEYRVFKPIMWIVSFIILGLMFSIFAWDSFSGETHAYTYCDESVVDGCFNVFYRSNMCDGIDKKVMFFFTQKDLDVNSEICTTEHMLAGQTLGIKPPFVFEYFWYFVIGLTLLGTVVNHLIFNINYTNDVKEIIGGNL